VTQTRGRALNRRFADMYDRALNLVKQIASEDSENHYAHEYLEYIYSQMGKLDQAELEYSRA
jgi:tetratricopeptide (TPR) repeat protein